MREFDVFLPVGAACRPTQHLKEMGLRINSYPLDWQQDYTLDTVLHLFETGFEDFFLEVEDRGVSPTKKHRWVRDTLNSIDSIHHFDIDVSVEQGQKLLRDRTKQQYMTLDKQLRQSGSLLMICNRQLPLGEVQAFLKEFSNLYPGLTIEMVNIRSAEDMPSDTYILNTAFPNHDLTVKEYVLNDTIDIVTGKEYQWEGNKKMWKQILERYMVGSPSEA